MVVPSQNQEKQSTTVDEDIRREERGLLLVMVIVTHPVNCLSYYDPCQFAKPVSFMCRPIVLKRLTCVFMHSLSWFQHVF